MLRNLLNHRGSERQDGGVRAVVQRVLSANVTVGAEVVGAIEGPGLLVYLGVTHDDGPADVAWMARKIWDTRLLREEKSASDVDAPVLVVVPEVQVGGVEDVAAAAPAHEVAVTG